MDAASAAGTVLNALSLVDICIRGVRSLRPAMSFSEDYNAHLIRIDVACWKLSKWYELQSDAQLDNDPTCRFFLTRIDEALARAREGADRGGIPTSEKSPAQLEDGLLAGQHVPQNVVELQNLIQRQIRQTKRTPRLASRIMWTWCRKEDLDRTLDDVKKSVEHLYACFPPTPRNAISEARQSLVDKIQSQEQLALLADASRLMDEGLSSAASSRLGILKGHEYHNVSNFGNSNTFGNQYKGQASVPKCVVEGHSYKILRNRGHQNSFGDIFTI